jgi:hypothetical protein
MIAGPVDQVKATVQEFIDAGVDELVVAIFALRSGDPSSMERARAIADRFINCVAPDFR